MKNRRDERPKQNRFKNEQGKTIQLINHYHFKQNARAHTHMRKGLRSHQQSRRTERQITIFVSQIIENGEANDQAERGARVY